MKEIYFWHLLLVQYCFVFSIRAAAAQDLTACVSKTHSKTFIQVRGRVVSAINDREDVTTVMVSKRDDGVSVICSVGGEKKGKITVRDKKHVIKSANLTLQGGISSAILDLWEVGDKSSWNSEYTVACGADDEEGNGCSVKLVKVEDDLPIDCNDDSEDEIMCNTEKWLDEVGGGSGVCKEDGKFSSQFKYSVFHQTKAIWVACDKYKMNHKYKMNDKNKNMRNDMMDNDKLTKTSSASPVSFIKCNISSFTLEKGHAVLIKMDKISRKSSGFQIKECVESSIFSLHGSLDEDAVIDYMTDVETIVVYSTIGSICSLLLFGLWLSRKVIRRKSLEENEEDAVNQNGIYRKQPPKGVDDLSEDDLFESVIF